MFKADINQLRSNYEKKLSELKRLYSKITNPSVIYANDLNTLIKQIISYIAKIKSLANAAYVGNIENYNRGLTDMPTKEEYESYYGEIIYKYYAEVVRPIFDEFIKINQSFLDKNNKTIAELTAQDAEIDGKLISLVAEQKTVVQPSAEENKIILLINELKDTKKRILEVIHKLPTVSNALEQNIKFVQKDGIDKTAKRLDAYATNPNRQAISDKFNKYYSKSETTKQINPIKNKNPLLNLMSPEFKNQIDTKKNESLKQINELMQDITTNPQNESNDISILLNSHNKTLATHVSDEVTRQMNLPQNKKLIDDKVVDDWKLREIITNTFDNYIMEAQLEILQKIDANSLILYNKYRDITNRNPEQEKTYQLLLTKGNKINSIANGKEALIAKQAKAYEATIARINEYIAKSSVKQSEPTKPIKNKNSLLNLSSAFETKVDNFKKKRLAQIADLKNKIETNPAKKHEYITELLNIININKIYGSNEEIARQMELPENQKLIKDGIISRDRLERAITKNVENYIQKARAEVASEIVDIESPLYHKYRNITNRNENEERIYSTLIKDGSKVSIFKIKAEYIIEVNNKAIADIVNEITVNSTTPQVQQADIKNNNLVPNGTYKSLINPSTNFSTVNRQSINYAPLTYPSTTSLPTNPVVRSNVQIPNNSSMQKPNINTSQTRQSNFRTSNNSFPSTSNIDTSQPTLTERQLDPSIIPRSSSNLSIGPPFSINTAPQLRNYKINFYMDAIKDDVADTPENRQYVEEQLDAIVKKYSMKWTQLNNVGPDRTPEQIRKNNELVNIIKNELIRKINKKPR